MIITDPVDFKDKPVVLAISDEAANDRALREIEEWARSNGFVRSREYQLNIRQTKEGKRLYYSACYRLTEEDRRAASEDLHRIRARREAMPMTVPSDQLLREDEE